MNIVTGSGLQLSTTIIIIALFYCSDTIHAMDIGQMLGSCGFICWLPSTFIIFDLDAFSMILPFLNWPSSWLQTSCTSCRLPMICKYLHVYCQPVDNTSPSHFWCIHTITFMHHPPLEVDIEPLPNRINNLSVITRRRRLSRWKNKLLFFFCCPLFICNVTQCHRPQICRHPLHGDSIAVGKWINISSCCTSVGMPSRRGGIFSSASGNFLLTVTCVIGVFIVCPAIILKLTPVLASFADSKLLDFARASDIMI